MPFESGVGQHETHADAFGPMVSPRANDASNRSAGTYRMRPTTIPPSPDFHPGRAPAGVGRPPTACLTMDGPTLVFNSLGAVRAANACAEKTAKRRTTGLLLEAYPLTSAALPLTGEVGEWLASRTRSGRDSAGNPALTQRPRAARNRWLGLNFRYRNIRRSGC